MHGEPQMNIKSIFINNLKFFIIMKKCFFFLALMSATLLSAKQYCGEVITSNDGEHTITLTCNKAGEGAYILTVEGENLNGFGGTFFNPGNTDIRSTITSSSAEKIVCTMTSEPTFYTPLYVMMPGEVVFSWPSDVEWASCGGGIEDSEAPVMVAATLVSNDHKSAVIAVEATDNNSVFAYVVKYDEKEITCMPVDGEITVNNLTPDTKYSFAVYAKDIAGNVSENYKTVDVETDSFSYCEVALGHQGNPEFGDANGRCILTLQKKDDNTITVTLAPNTTAGATKKLDFLYVDPKFGAPITAGEQAESGEGVDNLSVDVVYAEGIPATFSLTIQWSHPAWPGLWSMDLNGVSSTELCGSTTTIINATDNAALIRKSIINGQLVLTIDGINYTAQGQMIK